MSSNELTHHYATSADGTKLSYYSTGEGPTILIIHGALCHGLVFEDLALALRAHFRVCIASRRGHGLSEPFAAPFADLDPFPGSSEQETVRMGNTEVSAPYTRAFADGVLNAAASDLEALVAATGAKYIIGHSAGALVVLHSLLPSTMSAHPALGALDRAILYEPPALFTDRNPSVDLGFALRWEAARAAGDEIGSVAEALKGIQLSPSWIPQWMMKLILGFAERRALGQQAAARERGEEDKGRLTMLQVNDTLRYDLAMVQGAIAEPSKYVKWGERAGGAERIKLLLMSGTKSPKYLRDAPMVLSETVPGAKLIEFPGADHMLIGGREMGGQPERAVDAIREFFQS
ncbi:Alpha/Beta hydrolase protein [Xylariales sp. PMI_506]|nr:Alpha/Beta hydrolase protein [Xylariales sp. PMI_506]